MSIHELTHNGIIPLVDCLIKRFKGGWHLSSSLNSKQVKAIAEFRNDIEDETIKLVNNPCLCGKQNDIVLTYGDRIGIPVVSKLCENCGLIRLDPYYSQDSLQIFYSKYYRKIYESDQKPELLFSEQRWRGSRVKEFVLSSVKKTISTVYEIGCGAGGLLSVFLEDGYVVSGCDLDVTYLEYGRQQGLDLVLGEMDILSKKGKADIIIISHVLEHIPNPGDFIDQLSSLLNPDGYLYIEVPGMLKKPFTRDIQNAHVYYFTLETLNNLMGTLKYSLVKGTENISAIYRRAGESKAYKENIILADKLKTSMIKYEQSSKRETIRNIIVRYLYGIPYLRNSIILKLARKVQIKFQTW